MARIVWHLATTASVLVALAGCPATSQDRTSTDPVIEITRLGWQVVDSGPLLRFRAKDGAMPVEVAVAEPGRPGPSDDPVRWAKTKLTGPQGLFGPLGDDCRGQLEYPDARHSFTTIECSVPPGPAGPRKGDMFLVKTSAGLQVIGIVIPASVQTDDLNYWPLYGLSAEGHGTGLKSRAARNAIAMFIGRDYYLAHDAGPVQSSIEGVYHYWRQQYTWNRGLVDYGADYVLFKNGEAWRSPGASIRDIDATKFKEARWNDWGSWRRAGNNVVLTMNGQAEVSLTPNQLVRYGAGSANERVEGSWASSSAGGLGTTRTNATHSLTLHANGRFEESGFVSVISTETEPARKHTGELAFAEHTPGQSGRYSIDGYTLELVYDDGRVARALFCWGGDGPKGHDLLVSNGAQYLGGLKR